MLRTRWFNNEKNLIGVENNAREYFLSGNHPNLDIDSNCYLKGSVHTLWKSCQVVSLVAKD